MLYRITALLVGAVLLSLGLSAWFDFQITALFLTALAFGKKALPVVAFFARKALADFFLKIIPRKLGMFLVTRGLLGDKAQQKINGYIALKTTQTKRRLSLWFTLTFLLRATGLMIFMVGTLVLSILWFDLWFMLIWLPHEIEKLLLPLWQSVLGMITNSTLFKLGNRIYQFVLTTWVGRLVVGAHALLHQVIVAPLERSGSAQRKRWLPEVEAWLERLPTVEIIQAQPVRHRASRNPFATKQMRRAIPQTRSWRLQERHTPRRFTGPRRTR